jgi:predicted AAA+ superfamily ATPase
MKNEHITEDSPNYFDLEDPVSLARLDEPRTALEPLAGLVVIDEVQRRPDLFPVLRVLADRRGAPARFLILGSASGELLRQSAETLAGRVEQIEITGFTLAELGAGAADTLWRRGGFPRAYLARSEGDSVAWRKQFIQTLLERDFPQWGVRVPAIALLRFWTMAAHYHGQTWNAAEPARALGVSPATTRRYLDLLLRRGDRLFGVECKRADAPRLTPSIRIALEDLGLDRVAVIYPGAKRYPLGESVEAVPLWALAQPGALFGAA